MSKKRFSFYNEIIELLLQKMKLFDEISEEYNEHMVFYVRDIFEIEYLYYSRNHNIKQILKELCNMRNCTFNSNRIRYQFWEDASDQFFSYADTYVFSNNIIKYYKQNLENKKMINKIKIFTKKNKLCNDVRNIIISFIIDIPEIQ